MTKLRSIGLVAGLLCLVGCTAPIEGGPAAPDKSSHTQSIIGCDGQLAAPEDNSGVPLKLADLTFDRYRGHVSEERFEAAQLDHGECGVIPKFEVRPFDRAADRIYVEVHDAIGCEDDEGVPYGEVTRFGRGWHTLERVASNELRFEYRGPSKPAVTSVDLTSTGRGEGNLSGVVIEFAPGEDNGQWFCSEAAAPFERAPLLRGTAPLRCWGGNRSTWWYQVHGFTPADPTLVVEASGPVHREDASHHLYGYMMLHRVPGDDTPRWNGARMASDLTVSLEGQRVFVEHGPFGRTELFCRASGTVSPNQPTWCADLLPCLEGGAEGGACFPELASELLDCGRRGGGMACFDVYCGEIPSVPDTRAQCWRGSGGAACFD